MLVNQGEGTSPISNTMEAPLQSDLPGWREKSQWRIMMAVEEKWISPHITSTHTIVEYEHAVFDHDVRKFGQSSVHAIEMWS